MTLHGAEKACGVDRVVNLLDQIENEICSRKLLAEGDRVVVAVSGGLDSMVLLHILQKLAKRHRWKLIVAHFNHQLRGEESDGDEAFVRASARKLRIPFERGSADVKRLALDKKISVEMAARDSRHRFLAVVAKRTKAETIALAHHANDQVELFLLRLLRGSGGEGLSGMKFLSRSPIDPDVSLIRPLLHQSRSTLLSFAKEQEIEWREDITNESLDMQRNEIRHRLVPRLREFQPALEDTVLRSMEIIGAESEFVRLEAERWLGNQTVSFETLSRAVQRRVLELQLRVLQIHYDFDLIEQLRINPDRFISATTGLEVLRAKSGVIEMREIASYTFDAAEVRVNLSRKAGIKIGTTELKWQKSNKQGISRTPEPQREQFDADKVGSTVVLRFWRPGDRFQPIGMKKTVKLQDLFTNLKVPATERRKRVVATTEIGEIFWVQGLRIGEKFKLTSGTKERLTWSWKNT